jgi:predicted RNA-binding Zn-ribbon protein involved in translation (DUF1610 family)
MNERSLYPSIPHTTPSDAASFNNNTDEELLGVLAQIERSQSQNYTAAASSQASISNRLPESRTFPSSAALAASSARAATSTRTGVTSAPAHAPTPSTISLYDELLRYQSEHGIQDENDAALLETTTAANPTKTSSRSRSASFADDDDDDDEVAVRRSRSELLNESTHSVHSSTSIHSSGTGTGSTISDRKLPARVPAMSGATYRKPISRNFFSRSKKSRGRSFNDGNGSVHENGIDIDDVNDYHPGKQRSLSPPPFQSLPYEGQNSSASTRSASTGSIPMPMPMPSQAQRHSSLPSRTKRQTSSISDPGDDPEFYDDEPNDHAPWPPVAREQESVLDQDEALARRLQDEYEGLSRHHSSSATMKSDEILSRQMEELMREQEQNERAPVRGSANSHNRSHSGQQRQPDQHQNQHQLQQQHASFANSAPTRNSNSNSSTGMMGSGNEGMMNADEIEEQRKLLMQIEEEQQARKQHRISLEAPMSTTTRRSLTTAAPTPAIAARNTSMPTFPAGASHEAEEQFRILERIREQQECEELAQALNLSRQTSPSSPPTPSSMSVGSAHGNRRPSIPRVGATWEARQNPNPQRSSIYGGGTGTGSATEYLQSQLAAMTEYERQVGRPDPNARQRSQSLTLPVDYNHNQQQQYNNHSRPHPSNTNHHHHNTSNTSYLNSHSNSHHSQQYNYNDNHIDGGGGDESHHRRQDMVRRGLVETQRAVQEGRAHVVRCQGCGERLQAPVHYSLVYCPTCGVISPGQSAQNNSNNSYNDSGSSSSAQRGQSFHHEGHNDRYNNNNSGSDNSASTQRRQNFRDEGHNINRNNNNNNNSGSSHSAQRGQGFHHEGHNDRWR